MADSRPWRKGGGQSRPWRSKAPVAAKAKGGGGLLSHVPGADIVGRGASDIYHAAVNSPAVLYYAGKALAGPTVEGALHGPESRQAKEAREFQTRVGKGLVTATIEDFRHPLRHPGYTALDILGLASLGGGTVARLIAATSAIRKGAKASEVVSAALRPKPAAPRTLRVGDLEITQPPSRAATTRAVQRLRDKRAQRALDLKPGSRRAKHAMGRAAKWNQETLRAEEAVAKAPAAALAAIGKHLKRGQQMALRVVAEEAPLNERIAATTKRMENAASVLERQRHRVRLAALKSAEKHIVDANGKPALRDPKLQAIYDRMAAVAGSREDLGKSLGMLTEESIQGRKTMAGRVAMGATYEKPTPGKLGRSKPLERARKRVARLEARYETQLAKSTERAGEPERVRIPGTMRTRPRTQQEVEARIGELEKALEPRIQAVYQYLRSAEPTAARGRNKQARRQATPYEQARGPTYQVGGGDIVKRDIKPTTPRTGEQAKTRDWQRAEEKLYQSGTREGAHPVFKKIAAQMDELDQLKALALANKEAPIMGTKPPGFGHVTGKGRKAQLVPSDIPPRGKYGPSVERLGGALGVARDELAQIEARVAKRRRRTGLIGHEDFEASPSSVYVPDIEQRAGRGGRITTLGAQGVIGQPRSPFRFGYTGGAKAAGLEPLKTTRAVAEAQLAVSKFHRLRALRDQMVRAASPAPRFDDDIAVRLDNLRSNERLPRDVQAFIHDPDQLATLEPAEQAGMFERVRQSIILGDQKHLRSLPEEQQAEFQRLFDENKVGWVPRKLLGDLAKSHAPLSSTWGKRFVSSVDATNNATKLAVLYTKVAYATPNLLGNAALNILQQGFAAPVHLRRAVMMQHRLGPGLTAMIDTLMHEGFAASLRGEQGFLAGTTQKAAGIWGGVVDKPFRRASFSYEAAREGFRSPAQVERLLTDPRLHDRLIHVTKRANREIIDYGRLGPKEREVVRRVIFFYPWIKGSAIYSGHLLMEHPAKAAVLGQAGKFGREENLRRLGPGPSYMEGSFPVGNRIINPTAAALFQQPAQVGAIIAALAGGGPTPEVAEASNLMTPALAIMLNTLAGKNLRTGVEYPRTRRAIPNVAFDTLVKGLPQYQLAQGVFGKSPSKLYPSDPWTALGRYGLGGLYPRPFNRRRYNQLGRREAKELRGG